VNEALLGTDMPVEGAATPVLVDAAPARSLLEAFAATVARARDVWWETLTITEFDLVELGNGCAVNRLSCVETHLFHDRLMRIGSVYIGPGATLGPASATLPDTKLGAHCSVGGRSVVLRGEELPAGTRWHGSRVVSR
jgi:non-ribosomal peptide synthetase-like protein